MKTCVSIPGGAIRSIICVPEIIEYISSELGYSLFDATDQSIGTSAGTITITQNALDITAKKRDEISLKAFFDQVDQQNKEHVTKIFPQKKSVQMLGINPSIKNGKPIVFQAPFDNAILPSVIKQSFPKSTMGDFSMRTAFTIYVPLEDGTYGVKLVTSYDTPDFPTAEAVGASCNFPVAFKAYDLKSEWLDQKPGKIIKAFDGGLGCPNPAVRGLEEVQKIAHIDEEIAVFSMMMVDKKGIDYKKLYDGGAIRCLDPLGGSPLTQIAFNALYNEPHRQMTHRAQSPHSRGLLKYYPIHIEITEADRKRYKVKFDSNDSSPDNLNAFQDLTYSYVRKNIEFRRSIEPVIRAFSDRMDEKNKENDTAFNETMVELSQKIEDKVIPIGIAANNIATCPELNIGGASA